MIEVISPDARVARAATKVIKGRVNKDGLMHSASRPHTPKKGNGSYKRKPKHK